MSKTRIAWGIFYAFAIAWNLAAMVAYLYFDQPYDPHQLGYAYFNVSVWLAVAWMANNSMWKSQETVDELLQMRWSEDTKRITNYKCGWWKGHAWGQWKVEQWKEEVLGVTKDFSPQVRRCQRCNKLQMERLRA